MERWIKYDYIECRIIINWVPIKQRCPTPRDPNVSHPSTGNRPLELGHLFKNILSTTGTSLNSILIFLSSHSIWIISYMFFCSLGFSQSYDCRSHPYRVEPSPLHGHWPPVSGSVNAPRRSHQFCSWRTLSSTLHHPGILYKYPSHWVEPSGHLSSGHLGRTCTEPAQLYSRQQSRPTLALEARESSCFSQLITGCVLILTGWPSAYV